MTVRANADSKFLLKYLLIGSGCLAFGLWGAYDGLFKYPQQIPIAKAWDELKANENLDDGERDARYKELAKENGWPSKHPGETVDDIQHLILWQYVFLVIGLGVGVPCLIWYLRNRGTWVEAEDSQIRSSWGQEVDINKMTQFDKKKWEKKGIGVLSYETSEGPKTFVVDDLKYSRQEMDEIVRLIESQIKPEMIVNGAPEAIENLNSDSQI